LDARLAGQLAQGCAALGVGTVPAVQARLLEYLDLLARWNRAYNLTAVRDPAQMIPRHLLDSLAVASYLPGVRIIDVGSGAGLPGVPLAVLFPDREFHLLDSNGKKTRFLFQVKTALGLDNMTVHQARAEEFRREGGYDAVLSRAFASLADMVACCSHLPGPGGRFLAMKGAYPQAELDAVSDRCDILAVHALSIPGLEAQRHLVEMALRRPGGQ